MSTGIFPRFNPNGGFYTDDDPQTTYVETTGSVVYVGYAGVGSATSLAVWKLKKVETAGSLVTILWADGNLEYDNVWDNRSSYPYS